MKTLDFHRISATLYAWGKNAACCGLASRSESKGKARDVFGETPNTAVGTTALPCNQNSEHSRLLAFIRGFINDSQKTKPAAESNMLIYFRQQP
jgi:hypothetical protein